MTKRIRLVNYWTRKETYVSPRNLRALGEAERRIRAAERLRNAPRRTARTRTR